MYVFIAGAFVYSQTYNYYCWVNKRKQSIKASIRILSTEYNERRLFARSSCQTGIQTHTHTIKCTYVYILVCLFIFIYMNICTYICRLAKRERAEHQDFRSISLSLQISFMSSLLTFRGSSLAGNLWRIMWVNWFRRHRLDLPLHYVGTLFVTILWVFLIFLYSSLSFGWVTSRYLLRGFLSIAEFSRRALYANLSADVSLLLTHYNMLPCFVRFLLGELGRLTCTKDSSKCLQLVFSAVSSW